MRVERVPRLPVLVAVATAGLLAACSSGAEPVASPTAPAVTATTTTVDAATTSDAVTTTAAQMSRAGEWCAREGTAVAGAVMSAEITEASGVVASRAHPGVLWVHNDGADARLFAVGDDGRDLGVFDVGAPGALEVTDVEDIALVERGGVAELLLADFGDNATERPSIRLIRVVEPDPSSPGPIEDVDIVEFVYPDGAHNAEALLVDEANGTFVIVTKEQDDAGVAPDGLGTTLPAQLFEGPLDAPADGGPVELVLVGTIDLPGLQSASTRSPAHPAELFGAAGVVTGGDVAADGSLVALRTYQTVWLWDRVGDERVVDALAGEPCEVAAAFERQGEAIAVLDDGLLTVGEGINPPLHLLAV